MRFIFKLLILSIAILILIACGSGSGSSTPSQNITPLYVTIFSHNEDSWGNIANTPEKYWIWREDLVERMKIMASYGAKLSWQSDIAILNAIMDFEAGADKNSTQGRHLLRYMTKDLLFSAEPHAHKTSYADLMHLYALMDINASAVIGGLRMFECGDSLYGALKITDWRKTLHIEEDGMIHGELFPLERFKPAIISVPSFGGHWFDGDKSGAWHPGDAEDYYESRPQESIIAIGQGYPADTLNIGQYHASGAKVHASNAAYIIELIEQIRSKSELQGQFMTASISTRDEKILMKDGVEVNTHEGIDTMLKILQPYVDSGEIIYVTYPEAAEIWQEQFHSKANLYSFENSRFFKPMLDEVKQECSRL